MRVTADQEGHRCTKCGEYIKVGQEINWSPALPHLNVAADRHHVSCPEKKKKAAGYVPDPRRGIDREELFVVRKCSRESKPMWNPATRRVESTGEPICGQVTTFKKGDRVPSQCPYCQAPWVRGNPEEVAWAA